MSAQTDVRSIDALKELRVAMALYEQDAMAALGLVEAEVRRTLHWLHEERPIYWHDQIKKRRELVSQAKADLFRKKLQQRPDYTPPMSEQKENLRKAEASLEDAERRLILVRKWQQQFKQAVLEYHASVQRIKDLSASDVPRGVILLGRLIDSLEAYLRVAPPATRFETDDGKAIAPMAAIATQILDEDRAAAQAEASAVAAAEASAPAAEPAPAADDPTGAGPAVE